MWRTVALLLLCGLAWVSADSELRNLFRRDSKHGQWNYEDKTGPANWPQMYKKCGGARQSPVDIDPDEADPNPKLGEITFDNYDDPLRDAVLKNNGHTVVVLPGDMDDTRTIKDGGLDDTYKFLEVHFHWGADSKRGSEHTIDDKKYPLEMHFVHQNMNYKTKEAALQKEDGLAVLGVLFKVSNEDNPALEPIIDKLDEVRKENHEADLEDIDLDKLLPEDLMPYFRYRGSLTTPPCSEAVIWTVFEEFAYISEKQLQVFRSVKEEDVGEPEEALVDNFRPTQELHGRIIEVSVESHASATAPSLSLLLLLGSCLFVLRRW